MRSGPTPSRTQSKGVNINAVNLRMIRHIIVNHFHLILSMPLSGVTMLHSSSGFQIVQSLGTSATRPIKLQQGIVKVGVGSKIRPKNARIFFYSSGVLLQITPVLVSSRLWFPAHSRTYLVSVSYSFDRHGTDTLGCYKICTHTSCHGRSPPVMLCRC